MRFPGDTFPSVDPLAVQWGTDGAFVWAIRDGIAERMPSASSSATPTACSSPPTFTKAYQVVTEGVHNVREGARCALRARRRDGEPRHGAEIAFGRLPTSGS
jgi:hypothetical protein